MVARIVIVIAVPVMAGARMRHWRRGKPLAARAVGKRQGRSRAPLADALLAPIAYAVRETGLQPRPLRGRGFFESLLAAMLPAESSTISDVISSCLSRRKSPVNVSSLSCTFVRAAIMALMFAALALLARQVLTSAKRNDSVADLYPLSDGAAHGLHPTNDLESARQHALATTSSGIPPARERGTVADHRRGERPGGRRAGRGPGSNPSSGAD